MTNLDPNRCPALLVSAVALAGFALARHQAQTVSRTKAWNSLCQLYFQYFQRFEYFKFFEFFQTSFVIFNALNTSNSFNSVKLL